MPGQFLEGSWPVSLGLFFFCGNRRIKKELRVFCIDS